MENSSVCPICAGASGFLLTVESYDIYRCGDCGHGFLHPYPGAEELEQAYNTGNSEISNSNSFAMLEAYKKDASQVHYYYKWVLKECRSILEQSAAGSPRILDVGCSTGVVLRCLKDMGYEDVLGIEFNRRSAEAGTGELGVPIISKPAEELCSGNEKFDLILSLALLEHLAEPWKTLQTYHVILNSGGSVLFLVPNFGGFARTLMGEKWIWYMPPFHIHHFTVKSMKAMAEAQGFKASKMTTANTGTYLYLISHMIFGDARTQLTTKQNIGSLKLARRLDGLARFFLWPGILLLKSLEKEAHIVGVITK